MYSVVQLGPFNVKSRAVFHQPLPGRLSSIFVVAAWLTLLIAVGLGLLLLLVFCCVNGGSVCVTCKIEANTTDRCA